MAISFHSHHDFDNVIPTKFCACGDSCAVVACAKNCCDLMASNGIMARRNLLRIWIADNDSLVKRAPVPCLYWFWGTESIVTALGNMGNKPYESVKHCFIHKSLHETPVLICGLHSISWWRHQMETFFALLAICAGNSPVTSEFPAQRPVTRSFDVFADLLLNKRLSK